MYKHWDILLNSSKARQTQEATRHFLTGHIVAKNLNVSFRLFCSTKIWIRLVYGWQSFPPQIVHLSDWNVQQGRLSRGFLFRSWSRSSRQGLPRCYVLSGPRAELQVRVVLADHPVFRVRHPVAVRRVVPPTLRQKSGFLVALHGPEQVLDRPSVHLNRLKCSDKKFWVVFFR